MVVERPRVIIQSDWEHSLSGENGSAWITYKNIGKTGLQGNVKRGQDGKYECSEGFTVNKISGNCLTLSYEDGTCQFKCRYQSPTVVFKGIHAAKKNVVCVDVTAGGLGASCDADGKLRIWTTDSGEVRRDLTGHYSDVNVCRFFPSGIVLLTGGSDTLVKIWSVETGQCAATLKGHRAGVNDVTIVERGRNVVSVSRDGTARLWDCGQSACITAVSDPNDSSAINCCSLGVTSADVLLHPPSEPCGEREVLTEGKMLLTATESGSLKGHGLRSRTKIFDLSLSSPVNCCSFLTDSLAICGTEDSKLATVDLRNTSKPLLECQESRSAILSVLPHSKGCFITTGDGSCYQVDKDLNAVLELTGADCDPVYRICSDSTSLYTSCRDGLIRKYKATSS